MKISARNPWVIPHVLTERAGTSAWPAIPQADIKAARVDQRRWILRHQLVGDGMFGEIDGVGLVPLRIRIFSPAITDDQNEGAFHFLPFVDTKHDTDSPQRHRERGEEIIFCLLLCVVCASAGISRAAEKVRACQKTIDPISQHPYIVRSRKEVIALMAKKKTTKKTTKKKATTKKKK